MNTAAPDIGNWGRRCVYCARIFALDGKRYTETCSPECAGRMKKWREWQSPVPYGTDTLNTYNEGWNRTLRPLPAGGRTLTAAIRRSFVGFRITLDAE